MNWLKMLTAESDGSPSTMRIGVLIVLAGMVFEHAWGAAAGKPLDWTWQDVLVVVGALGAKSVQKAFETKPETKPAEPEKKG